MSMLDVAYVRERASQLVLRINGDVPGHEFHGNQWTEGPYKSHYDRGFNHGQSGYGFQKYAAGRKGSMQHKAYRAGYDDGNDASGDLRRDFRIQGGAGSGDFHHAGRPGEVGGSGEATVSDRVERAKRFYSPANVETQRHAEANELRIREMVKGTRTDDNLPVDVIAKVADKIKGIEVKTLVSNTNDKITMNATALQNKMRWARQNHATVHTVVIDDRAKFSPKNYSGHDLYYRRGSGSFRISSMTKVTGSKHLLELLAQR